jgi:hypothetical protein
MSYEHVPGVKTRPAGRKTTFQQIGNDSLLPTNPTPPNSHHCSVCPCCHRGVVFCTNNLFCVLFLLLFVPFCLRVSRHVDQCIFNTTQPRFKVSGSEPFRHSSSHSHHTTHSNIKTAVDHVKKKFPRIHVPRQLKAETKFTAVTFYLREIFCVRCPVTSFAFEKFGSKKKKSLSTCLPLSL